MRSAVVTAAAARARPGLGLVTGVVVASALVVALAACTTTDEGPAVERLVVCLGPDAQHPAGTPASISLRQGGREVASAGVPYGTLVALLVPRAQTAVFVDGVATGGAAGFGGDSGELDPASQPAPDEATIAAAAATDPSTVNGYIALTGPGCPQAPDVKLD